ncbi:hypothetical protein [Streptomyces nigra]|uniref:hypothetical protein n=1 Tax=Streptomyces nigra TaxID=1827580 RepID=UPI00363CD1D6
MTGRPILAVLAANFTEFRRWCHDSGLSTRDPQVVYIDRPERLRGMTDVKFIRCPYAWKHPKANDIYDLVQYIEQRRTRR